MAEDDPSTNPQAQPEAPSGSQQPPGDSGSEARVAEQLNQTQVAVDELQADVDSAASTHDPQAAALDGSSVQGRVAGGDIDLLGDVDLDVSIELGRTEMLVEDVLKLGSGSVVELDKLAGDPVDVYVNGRIVARGEVLVLNDNFCIRISEIVANLEEQAEVAAEEQTSEPQQA